MKYLFHALVGLVVMVAADAGATDWVVGTSQDLPDTNPGDGSCITSQGPCSLRAAIEESNALGGGHTITLGSSIYFLTHTSGSAIVDFDVTADVEVYGAGLISTAVDGSSATAIFDVATGARLRLESMIVRNGRNEFNPGGCIINRGTLELQSVFISGCVSEGGEGGGAVVNLGSLTGNYAIFFDNHSGSGAEGAGGGLDNRTGATASLYYSSFIENTAGGSGGGIYNDGMLVLEDVTIRDGEATSFTGGGIVNRNTATLESVTVSGNHAGSEGGGIDQRDGGDLTMINSTVSGNSAGTGGGGLALGGNSTTSLTHVTLAGNSDPGTAAAIYQIWGSTSVELVNTLISSGGATNCSYVFPFTSMGHNMEDLDTCGLGATGDQVNTTPLLGPLQDNGGWTHTVALLEGSPGIDDGDGTLGITVDQRGFVRPLDGDGDLTSEVDIGAYELAGPIFANGFESGDTSAWSSAVP